MERRKNSWTVTLQREDGPISTQQVQAYWDPEQVTCNEAVGHAGRIQARAADGKRRDFAVISVEHVA